MAFRHKAKKTSLQFTIPENLDNNEDPKRDIHGLIYMGSRKIQDLLGELGVWIPSRHDGLLPSKTQHNECLGVHQVNIVS